MNISYNFISLVALGNFNPAIVSPDFLNNVCKLNLGEPDDQTPPMIPVHKSLRFGNLKFTVDMDRFEIMITEIKDIFQTKTLDIFKIIYYETLPHTPIKAVGVNINCDLVYETDTQTDLITEKARDPVTCLNYFDSNEINVVEQSIRTKTDRIWMGSNYILENVRGLTRRINIKRKRDSFRLNYNYEVGNWDENERNRNLLIEEYQHFCNEFLKFVKSLED